VNGDLHQVIAGEGARPRVIDSDGFIDGDRPVAEGDSGGAPLFEQGIARGQLPQDAKRVGTVDAHNGKRVATRTRRGRYDGVEFFAHDSIGFG